jgi:CheY-like chemotaxis protein
MSHASTILCIDDEAQILSLRKQLLETHGFKVLTARSGREGLRLLAEGHAVDLVLLDYMMPGMTGDRIAAEVKRLYPRLPIVVMSGFPDLPKALLTIADGYVRKGQDPEFVIGAITSALASKAQPLDP